ncbi:hypothetical protein CHH28_07035 [Bacterioplanes sanyensis]|uniref:Alpha-L-fucosidase n=1 Tax=Bacterioplanes sanyensis TaxID=1249553 RepID=A0A222FJ44_9GAMM|nr:amidoligase family protein [Bacterioplanes sanyensis]ASP38441.1 hypothetical protein CHH28_07035 [Bacterioplanes sanyensis]
MARSRQNTLLPPVTLTADQQPRRIGVEVEFAGLPVETILAVLQDCYGGDVIKHNQFEYELVNSQLGTFLLELDAQQLKQLAQSYESGRADNPDTLLEDMSMELLSLAAEQFVPWEIVTSPITLEDLHRLDEMTRKLRQRGAKGTRESLRFAFGVHLNMELPALDAETILAYMRAYFCLYDWIVWKEDIDLVRRVTPYINHFPQAYIEKVIHLSYRPTLEQLIDDYLLANPTRNRSLDMLPLFMHLDAERVRRTITDKRVTARPTLHYRLPNCDIDNPNWSIDNIWREWLQVEWLASDAQQLDKLCRIFRLELQRLTRFMDNDWAEQCQHWLVDLDSQQ